MLLSIVTVRRSNKQSLEDYPPRIKKCALKSVRGCAININNKSKEQDDDRIENVHRSGLRTRHSHLPPARLVARK